MELYFIVKTLHIMSATVLFGTGLGIAFFMFRAQFSEFIAERYFAARTTVLADYIFTFPAAVFQPISGAWLIKTAGFNWLDTWLVATYVLYFVAAMCWIPVVWIQIRLKSMLKGSIEQQQPLPGQYQTLFKIWFLLGWPAFIGLVGVFFLMVLKPV